MHEIAQALVIHYSLRRPRRIVTVSGRGVRGIFPSRKSAKPAQFESLVEEMTLRLLEAAPSVRSIATQPRVFEYADGISQRRYTPDVEIEIDGADRTAFLEVKDDATFTPDSKAAARISAALPHLRQRGHRLHIVLRSDLVANDLQRQLGLLFRMRPLRARYRPDIDSSLWDPENGSTPPADVQQQWEDAKRQCDELLRRIMKRDPDDLLAVTTR
ncbi:Tn7 transposase TnsA N-terminal domain-containing protein [Paraburkholderia sediminicola]|uniref:Tn7 transposase TnsA N-terminal domain-containing protein n=1 Tax=Paraburkholderia sediminicola TaxID=458836 RepID=UPI0038BB7E94